MRIILLERVESLGGIGDIVEVRPGYGRNYLLPQGKAAPATDEQVAAFELRRAELLALEKERMAATTARAGQVRAAAPLVIVANAGPAGKLYGSVGPAEISAGFSEAGVEVARAEVQMPEGPIKELGEHRVVLKLHADVTEEIAVHVVGQESDIETLPGAEPLPSDDEEEAEDGDRTGFTQEAEATAQEAEAVAQEADATAQEAEAAQEAQRTEGDTEPAGPTTPPEGAANRSGDG